MPAKSDNAEVPHVPLRITASVASGLILICLALFVFGLTLRTILFWLSKDDYVRTEIEVTGFSPDWQEPIMFAKVIANGEEMHSNVLPTELYKYDSASDATGTLVPEAEAKGKRIPIWFAETHTSFFTSRRYQYVSEFEELPSGALVAKIVAVNLAICGLGVWLTRRGIRAALLVLKQQQAGAR